MPVRFLTIHIYPMFGYANNDLDSPLKALFDILPKYPHTCSINSHELTYAASIANTITDLLTTMIPVTLVGTLHLPYRQRIAIMTIFLLGVFVNVAGALRTYYVHRSMVVTNLDRSWTGWPTCISAIVEIGLGLVRYHHLMHSSCVSTPIS